MLTLRHALTCASLLLAPASWAFTLSSPAIPANQSIPASFEFNGFGCTGLNQSPQLTWADAPADTQSFAITVHDPDAPTGGSGWWHWQVVNIPASTTHLVADAGSAKQPQLPRGARQLTNDYGYAGWGGVCPPVGHGKHRYVFTIHALKVPTLPLPENPSAALAGYLIQANSLASASFNAFYERREAPTSTSKK